MYTDPGLPPCWDFCLIWQHNGACLFRVNPNKPLFPFWFSLCSCYGLTELDIDLHDELAKGWRRWVSTNPPRWRCRCPPRRFDLACRCSTHDGAVPVGAESAQLGASSQSSFSVTGVAFQPFAVGGGDTKSMVLGPCPSWAPCRPQGLQWVGAQGRKHCPHFMIHAPWGRVSVASTQLCVTLVRCPGKLKPWQPNPSGLLVLYSHYFWTLGVMSLRRSRWCWFCSYLLLLEDAGSELRL